MAITIRQEGRRIYLEGNTYPLKSELDKLGTHYERRDGGGWNVWVGSGKKAEVEALVANRAAAVPTESDADRLKRDQEHILGKATYKGRSYYLVGEGMNARGAWLRLMFTDGTKTFFADGRDGRVERRYQSPKTFQGLREYAKAMKLKNETGVCGCFCHKREDCRCEDGGYCQVHHDGCDHCGCES